MSSLFYPRLALSNLKKNSKFYLPNILTGIGLTASLYIIMTLTMDERLSMVRGGNFLPTFMGFGTFVLMILAFILILYSNAFLMRQRKKELGLYNILGMEKRHVARVLFYESLFSALLAILSGILTGMVLYKLCTLLICRLLRVPSILGIYYLGTRSWFYTVAFFLFSYFVAYCWNLFQLKRMNPVELLVSSHVGEREPRIRWILLLLGAVTLAAGYYLALTTNSPLRALNRFFSAVLLVIVATYFLFVAGSIFILKALKKNKNYYYKKQHMAVVSGLIYRMKQNAVGLASICIMSCAVLVMLSTTICLYVGIEQTLDHAYPYKYFLSASIDDGKMLEPVERDILVEIAKANAYELGNPITDFYKQKELTVYYEYQEGGVLSVDQSHVTADQYIVGLNYMTAQDYLEMTGEDLKLADDELALCYLTLGSKTHPEQLTIAGKTYKVTKTLEQFPLRADVSAIVDTFGIILPSEEDFQTIYDDQRLNYIMYTPLRECVAFRFQDESSKTLAEFGPDFEAAIHDEIAKMADGRAYGTAQDSYWDSAEQSYGMYGTLLFLGLLLGFVFLFATTLIIYYKQISEGYEDRTRFQIMQKIGLSEAETKATIRRQILMVFFLPLLVSGIHIIFAFKILTLLLHIFLSTDDLLFAGYSVLVYIGFAIIYTMIYAYTAKAYYKIVH